MKFKVGQCCCSRCIGNNTCYDGKITQIPNSIYVIVSGAAFNPEITDADLKRAGVIPNNLSGGGFTGWTIDTTISYSPDVLGWFFNKKFKLKNQTAWEYERLGKDHVATGFFLSDCLSFLDNPYSGGRQDCYYEYSQIRRIIEEVYVQGCTDVPGWNWKYYAKNLNSAPTGIEPEPDCPSSKYFSPLDHQYNICPKPSWGSFFCNDETVANGCGEGYFMCGVLADTENQVSFLDYNVAYYVHNKHIVMYMEDRLGITNTNESITQFLDDDSENLMQSSSCGLGLTYPRLDFGFPEKAGGVGSYDGTLRFQAVGHELLDSETERGVDPDFPGKTILGISLLTPQTLPDKTYISYIAGPRVGLTVDFKVPIPIDYGSILEQKFLPWTGGSLDWHAKTTLTSSNADLYIKHNITGIVSCAIGYYGNVINGYTGTVKDADYKFYTCGYSGINITLTCDPTDAYEVFL